MVLTSWSAQGKWVLQCPQATRGQRHPGAEPPSALVSRALGHHWTHRRRGRGGGQVPAGLLPCSLDGPQGSAAASSGKFIKTQPDPLRLNPS